MKKSYFKWFRQFITQLFLAFHLNSRCIGVLYMKHIHIEMKLSILKTSYMLSNHFIKLVGNI